MTFKAGDIVLDSLHNRIGTVECFYGDRDIGVYFDETDTTSRYTEDVFYNELNWSIESVEDTVDHPSHYNQGGIEAIDSIRASLTAEEFSGFCKGNIMKYVIREKHKNGVEDLKKAQKYLEWLVEHKQNPDN